MKKIPEGEERLGERKIMKKYQERILREDETLRWDRTVPPTREQYRRLTRQDLDSDGLGDTFDGGSIYKAAEE